MAKWQATLIIYKHNKEDAFTDGIIGKRILCRGTKGVPVLIIKLFSVVDGAIKQFIGTFDFMAKELSLNCFTPFCDAHLDHEYFNINAKLLDGIYEYSPISLIRIRFKGKWYETTLRYLTFTSTYSEALKVYVMSKKDFGLRTAKIWEDFIDTRHLEGLTVFDMYRLKLPLAAYAQALQASEAYQKRFCNSGNIAPNQEEGKS